MYWKAVRAPGLLAERLKNGVVSEPLPDEQTSLPVEASHFTSWHTLSPSSVMLPLLLIRRMEHANLEVTAREIGMSKLRMTRA